jgi:hypothetical protein
VHSIFRDIFHVNSAQKRVLVIVLQRFEKRKTSLAAPLT